MHTVYGFDIDWGPMNIAMLIKRLIEIEQALDVKDNSTLRRMVWDVQECALQIQKEAIENRRSSKEMMV